MGSIAFVVDRRENGQTLASVLKVRYGLSWSHAKRLVEKRHVKVGGQVETDVARRLKIGRRVEVAAGTIEGLKTETAKPLAKPAKANSSKKHVSSKGKQLPIPSQRERNPKLQSSDASGIAIVYADDAVAVVNKPAGLTTMRHREEAEEFGARARKFLPKTLAELLPGLLGTPGRPVTAVHRIDRDTSGLVVFARTRAAADNLNDQFRKHRVDRRYLALTRGVPKSTRVESILVRDRGDGRRGSQSKSSDPEGKRAITHLTVVEDLQKFAVVECRLETGRTHQVRIHLGEAGTPLCGETVYDRPLNGKPFPDGSGAMRPLLHAFRLGFKHPETGEAMQWEIAPPNDFAAIRKKIAADSAARPQ